MRLLTLSILLLCSLALHASPLNNSISENAPNNPPALETDCDLPAPTNATQTGAGTTWMSFAWDEVPGAIGYQVTVTEAISGIQVAVLTTGTNSILIENLNPGTEYTVEIAALCAENMLAEPVQTNGSTIIIDIVVEIAPPSTPTVINCAPMPPSGNSGAGNILSCELPFQNGVLQPIWGEVVAPDGKIFRFGIQFNALGTQDFTIGKSVVIDSIPFAKLLDEQGAAPSKLQTLLNVGYGSVNVNGNEVCRIHIHKYDEGGISNDEGIIDCEILERDYTFRTIVPEPGKDRSDLGTDTKNLVVNPFDERLKVQFGTSISAQTELQLYNVEGALLLQTFVPEGQTQLDIPASNIAPGIYFLRIQTDGHVETHKVVKALN